MAKAKEIIELDCSGDALEGALRVLRTRFEEIIEFREAALDFSQVKGVHDMRVAARRLRSALRDFAPLLKKRFPRQIKTDLKKLADALGTVRDQDVAILALEKLQSETENEKFKAGLEIFIHERRDQRKLGELVLAEALETESLNDLQKRFTDMLDKISNQRKPVEPLSFKDFGHRIIMSNLNEFCDLSPALYTPLDSEKLHDLRISAKRLRYAIQLFTPCLDKEIKPFTKEISRMQTFLGNTHDYDDWTAELGNFLAHKQKTVETDYQTAVWLMAEFAKTRAGEYCAALELWGKWEANYLIARLRAMVS